MRRVVTVAAAFMAVLAIAPAATAQAETVTVTEFSCGGALPFTGSSTIPTLAIGLVMLAVGLALVRRNRTSGWSV
jgi:LPXTG-motif cell wall-anchored protein